MDFTFETIMPTLLGVAWLLPLASFTLIVFFGRRMGKAGHCAGYLAAGAIIGGFVLSTIALITWISHNPLELTDHHGDSHHAEAAHEPDGHEAAAEHDSAAEDSAAEDSAAEDAAKKRVRPVSGDWYSVGKFGSLELTIGYYIDGLTVAMFFMVTLISSCIHVYAFGYMHEELEDVTDPLVTLSSGRNLHRPGRYCRFFQYLSLFCFSMLGLVIAGNIAMVFVFWELVGICSYFLIGFYIERRSASNAANKAFIVNRVGDFGMIIGMMALWTGLGTFSFDDVYDKDHNVTQVGMFNQVRPAENDHQIVVPRGMVEYAVRPEIEQIVLTTEDDALAQQKIEQLVDEGQQQGRGYWLLVVAGVGIFCGCVGKSAQFPLHVWLPDAMEGPTPVSALVHSATMVAAGVYLVGRFYPVFTPEVLLVIAYTGCITLFMAATIAITATDIKRVLAYSTISQLGYMMLSLGLGGWLAGLFHLFTHAFFKSLLFMCSGSVIHACHTNEMPQMGGLLKKMPYTGWTMLVGCLAIAGAGIPPLLGFGGGGLSGYYSKDYIIAQAMSFKQVNPGHAWLFHAAVVGAAITAFYMFRMWYMTFVGKPRDEHIYAHAHESPKTMYVPLIILATMATIAGWNLLGTPWGLEPLLEQARPLGTETGGVSAMVTQPPEALIHGHDIHVSAGWTAFTAALIGFGFATLFYGVRKLDAEDARKTFAPIHRFLLNKWWFDELYERIFIRPVMRISGWITAIDQRGLDWLADNSARLVRGVARIDAWIDRVFVDGLIHLTARWTHAVGLKLREVQTGSLRQYVMFLAVGLVALFILISMYWNIAVAGS